MSVMRFMDVRAGCIIIVDCYKGQVELLLIVVVD